ncbi:MAG: pyruvate formate-lyase 1-activating enzyme [Clostridiales bacterium 43-6]|nr:MAG: pyruvate formate-lyase 1-activating enzyme [Clostridiales bacterium 43-6]
MDAKGRIHSVESFGALDGPGIRFVVFFQGCPLRCLYCHNPDTWDSADGTEYTVNELVEKIKKYGSFLAKGGVTLSGGEPLLQYEFVYALLKELKRQGIHTAIDTSGAVPLAKCGPAVQTADMIILDIKAISEELCRRVTGADNRHALRLLDFCEEIGKPVWIRHVLVPDLTMDYRELEQMADYLKGYRCISRIELLPFHKMGEYKWEAMNSPYTLTLTREPTEEEIERAKKIFADRGLTIK